MKKVMILFDGSCLRNGHPDAAAGWGIVVSDAATGQTLHSDNGKVVGKQTNNRAELTAFHEALKWMDQHNASAVIQGDSQLVLNGVQGLAKRKANRDLWSPIEKLCQKLSGRIKVEKVCRETNNDADELARIGANKLI